MEGAIASYPPLEGINQCGAATHVLLSPSELMGGVPIVHYQVFDPNQA